MRRIRRLLSAILVLLGVVTIVPGFGGIASAHHSNIAASVSCGGTVSWTASSWATGPSGTNSDVRVYVKVGSTTTQIAQGVFNNANNYRFSGTFPWPSGATSIVVSSKPYATWGNGVVSPQGSTLTVQKPTCPGQPGVSKSVSCTNTSPGNGDGTVVLTLTNAAGQFGSSVTFAVYNPDQTSTFTNYPVANGQTTQVTFSGLADGNHSVKIVAGTTNLSQSFTIDCDSPIPSVTSTVTCANGDGQIVVTLSNTGGEAVVFNVTNPSTNVVEPVTVNANSSATRTFTGFGDGQHTVVVTVGTTDFSQTFTVDCDHAQPKVSSAVSCVNSSHDGAVSITLANEGTESVVFQVTNPFTGVVQNVTVGIGGSTLVTFAGFTDGNHTVVVTADGQDYSQVFAVHCDLDPSFSHVETCVNGDGNVDVTMSNDGDDVDAVFVLNGVSHTLAPGATKVVTLSGLTDGSHLVPLTVNGVDKSFIITVDCDRPGQPAVEIAQSCANEDGTVVVTLKNIGGELPLTFTVEGADYVVAADSSVDVSLSGLNDGDHTIAINQGALELSRIVSIHCDQAPTVDHSQTCIEGDDDHADGQVVVTLNNNGDDVAVTFTVNGTDYEVGPKESTDVVIEGLADGDHIITVTAGEHEFSFAVSADCDHPGEGKVSVSSDCVDNDGRVIVTLIADGGELPVVFTVNGVDYSVDPDSTFDVVISGLNDGRNTIAVFVGGHHHDDDDDDDGDDDDGDLSFTTDTSCDLPPVHSYVQACANFDDTVSVLIGNPGDDVAVTFTINGTDYALAPGASQTVLIENLPDGENTITLAINGHAQEPIIVTSNCDPAVTVVGVCNSVNGEITEYWFTITNNEAVDVTVAWAEGTATVPAGGSTTVAAASAVLTILHNGAEIASAPASEQNCERTVTFIKELKGQPVTGETYTIRVSRLVGENYLEVLTFDLNAGTPKTINLPSTLDPAGIDYKIDEINAGTANTSAVSPDQLKLSGHAGETVSVVVTNGYAAVQIDKISFTSTVVPGGQVTYALQVANTGGLTLNPVVVSDRLPSMVEFVSATVDSNAGQCALSDAARPQLITCMMNDALAPGASAKLITVVVKVDATFAGGITMINQAMVHGAYVSTIGGGALIQNLSSAGLTGAELSCVPVMAGTVCDLSAKVGVPVGELQQEVSAVAEVSGTAVVRQLPRTGASHLFEMLATGIGCVLLGGVLLLSRRRVGVR